MDNADDQFSLKWNNFQSNLATGFHDLLQEEDMVDVTLAAEGKFVQAHKIILSVCSPYFKDLFKVNPCKHPIVILKDVGHQELSDMLDFMYRGEASVRQEDLSAFLKLAETLKVKGLAGDRSLDEPSAPSQPVQSQRKPVQAVKKKRVVEQTVFDPDDDPGEELTPSSVHNEPKRKRRRPTSPQFKTESSPSSAGNAFAPLTNPKQEVMEEEEDNVEFLEEGSSIPLVDYMAKNKHDVDFDDSNLDMTGGEDGQDDTGDMSTSLAGPSNADDGSDQVPPDRNPVWYLFERLVESSTAQCRLCGLTMQFRRGTSISNLESHLLSKVHGRDIYERYISEKNAWKQRKLSDFTTYGTPKEKHPIFSYFLRSGDKAVCLVCSRSMAYKGPSYITSLSNHLSRVRGHEACYQEYATKCGIPVEHLRAVKTEPGTPEPILEPMVELHVPSSTTISRVYSDIKPNCQYYQSSTNHNYYPRSPHTPVRTSGSHAPPHDFSNPIWDYFSLEEDKAMCKVCGKLITYRNNAYVTNLVTHLRTRGIGHDACYNLYMMKKSETSSKVRDEIALNYLLTNMASTVFGQGAPQQQPQPQPQQQPQPQTQPQPQPQQLGPPPPSHESRQ